MQLLGSMKHIIVFRHGIAALQDLARHLEERSFRVTLVEEETKLLRLVAAEFANAIILEVHSETSFPLIKRLASLTHAPIVVVSANFVDEDHKVLGLEAGATDYLAEPFGPRECVARLEAAVRNNSLPQAVPDRRSYFFDDFELSMRFRRLVRAPGIEIHLTAAEFNLLVAFLNAPKTALTREQLLSTSRVHSEEIADRSLDALIVKLRRKVERDQSNPTLIRTVRGIGYSFDADVKVDERPRPRRHLLAGV